MSLPKRRQSSRLNQGTLPHAIEKGNVSDVETLLFQGTPIGTRYILNRTALHIAASTDNEVIIDILLRYKAQVTDEDENKNTPLHFAAERGNLKIFKKLLEAPATNGGPTNINARNSELETPLHSAAFKDHANLIKYMIEHGAEVNARREDYGTPLHLAAAAGNPEAVKELLKCGANVNLRTENGSTPLHCAMLDVSYDKKEILFDKLRTMKLKFVQILKQDKVVSILLDAGANPNVLNNEFVSPLLYAVKRNHITLMRRLLLTGANVDLLDNGGRSALHHAAIRSCPEMIRILLDSGANVNLLSFDGFTPLHNAVSGRNQKIISMLICAGADIKMKTSKGHPIHFLIYSGRDVDLLRLLFECGADINTQDKKGFTFLHYFYRISDHKNILATLMELFVDLNISDDDNRTALECAQNIIRVHEPNRPISLIKLLAKMESDGKLTVNRQNEQIISNWYPEYYKECKKELEILKKRKVWDISFNDLLSKSINELAVYARNEKLLEILDSGACEEFQIYGNFIEIRMQMALTRKKMLDKSLEALTKLFSPKQGPKLPRFCGLDVLNYLNAVDLENLALA